MIVFYFINISGNIFSNIGNISENNSGHGCKSLVSQTIGNGFGKMAFGKMRLPLKIGNSTSNFQDTMVSAC